MILADMANIGMFKRVHKAARNTPIIVVVSDVETLGNRDRNRGRMIGVVRHTLGRKYFLPMVMSGGTKGSDDSDLLVFVC